MSPRALQGQTSRRLQLVLLPPYNEDGSCRPQPIALPPHSQDGASHARPPIDSLGVYFCSLRRTIVGSPRGRKTLHLHSLSLAYAVETTSSVPQGPIHGRGSALTDLFFLLFTAVSARGVPDPVFPADPSGGLNFLSGHLLALRLTSFRIT